MSRMPSRISNVEERALRQKLPISLLAGEMAGRPEGGAVPPAFPKFYSGRFFGFLVFGGPALSNFGFPAHGLVSPAGRSRFSNLGL